jgi:hypothetical protein
MFDQDTTWDFVKEQVAYFESRVTPEGLMKEAANLKPQGDEDVVINIVNLISAIPGSEGQKLYRIFHGALPTDKYRADASAEWSRVKTADATATTTEQFVFENEDDLIEAINAKCAVLRRGGSMQFVFWDHAGNPVFSMKRDAEVALAQYRLSLVQTVQDQMGRERKSFKELSGFSVWLKSPNRREFSGVGFYPDRRSMPQGHLNMWTGFAFDPAPGDWGIMRRHIHDNICNGNAEHFNFLMDWMSQLFFEPAKKSGVIPVLRGLPGTGKSIVGEWLCKIVGSRHSLVVDKGKHLTGNFNGHLEGKILILAEEAVFAGDPKAERALKHLATSKSFTYESKGVDARDGESLCRAFLTTNDDWAVAVDAMDRRYFVLDVSPARKEDKAFFAALNDQMENGGAAAMLYELQERAMTFARLGKPPMTDAKREQMRHSMSPKLKWLASVLTDGLFPSKDDDGVPWPELGGAVQKSDILRSYQAAVPGYHSPPSALELGMFLRKHVPNLTTSKRTAFGKRVPHYDLPALADVREAFVRFNPGYSFDVDVDVAELGPSPANDVETPDYRVN